jgi:serine/threonine-protein kinase
LTGKIVLKTIKTLLLVFVVVLTIAFSFWFGQTLYNTFWNVPSEVEVPNLIGEDAAVADNRLKEKGLSLKITDSKYQEKYASNTIIKQDPPGSIMVRKGREVLAVVSLGPELMEVPDLKGMSVRDSRVLLGNSKLKLGKTKTITQSKREPGEIVEQNPPAGEMVRKGTSINLEVNKGDEPMIKVPNLIGVQVKDVRKKLEDTTLDLGTVVWVWHDDIPRGDIIMQIPNPASMVQPRSQVDIKVSAGQKGFDLNLKQKTLVFFAPKGEGLQTIRVRQVDALGDKVIYEGQHAPGGKITLTVHCWEDAELQIFFNTKLAKRIRF